MEQIYEQLRLTASSAVGALIIGKERKKINLFLS